MRNTDLLQELYEGKKFLEIVFNNASPFIYTLKLLGRDNEPDCYISSFSANLWFRTVKGETRNKYKSYATMLSSVKKRAQQVLGDDVSFKKINIINVKEGETLPMF